MSYDIRLKSPVTGETLQLPTAHMMTGGTFRAEYNEATGQLEKIPIKEAWLNVTYNYAQYYYDATEGDALFLVDSKNGGIRGIYGKSGAESIPMLKCMIERIEREYKKPDGGWKTSNRKETRFLDKATGKELTTDERIKRAIQMRFDSVIREEYTELVYEGDTDNYWNPTAANALKPLYQLLAMAQLRPDGVWDGD